MDRQSKTVGATLKEVFFTKPAHRTLFLYVIPVLYLVSLITGSIFIQPWGLGLLAGFLAPALLVHLPALRWVIKKYSRQIANIKALEDAEARKRQLAEIQASMTPAEWELYKVQLQNQRLLRDIRDKQDDPSFGVSYGFFREVDN